jgi:hypothetical protein
LDHWLGGLASGEPVEESALSLELPPHELLPDGEPEAIREGGGLITAENRGHDR